MSLLGLYNYDSTLFENLVLPDGINPVLVRDNLLMETAELEVLYTDPDFMKLAIGTWSAKQMPVWTKMYKTTTIEYDPLENYNRTSTWETTNKLKTATNSLDSNADTSDSESTMTDKGTENDYTAAFNSDPLVNNAKTEHDDAQGNTTKISNSGTLTHDSTTDHDSDTNHTEHSYGNIGVTTNQDMLMKEREVATFNIIDYITDDFKKRFCLLVY
jgi:hypothetical protein